MTDWHPTLSDADPADAWYPPDKLERQHRAEQAESDFRRMRDRRNRFERAVANLESDDPEEVARLWEAADLDADLDDETSTE